MLERTDELVDGETLVLIARKPDVWKTDAGEYRRDDFYQDRWRFWRYVDRTKISQARP